jgi:hypothetical protein
MHAIRASFLRHRAMALAVVALALAMKALVPAGYMVGGDVRTLTVRICDGIDHGASAAIAIPMKPGAAGHGAGDKAGHDQQACPFSALGHVGQAGADPIQLALALAFIVLLGFAAPHFAPVAAPSRLRPPLRAPPALI